MLLLLLLMMMMIMMMPSPAPQTLIHEHPQSVAPAIFISSLLSLAPLLPRLLLLLRLLQHRVV
jgi:hypothetical protein